MKNAGIIKLIAVSWMYLCLGAPSYGADTCLPTCARDDARFLVVAANTPVVSTLPLMKVNITLAVPSTATTLTFGIFDGDAGKLWDSGAGIVSYTLYEDPTGDLSGSVQVWQKLSTDLRNNRWDNFSFAVGPGAETALGSYYYRLEVLVQDPQTFLVNSFKVRVRDGFINIRPPQPFAFMPFMQKAREIAIINPPSGTKYNGKWVFKFKVPEPTRTIEIWDGDFDHGNARGTVLDDDNVNTVADTVPAWAAGTNAVPERACVGEDHPRPYDDNSRALYRRTPSVKYHVIDPNGVVYKNKNPSGNLEWEKFLLSRESEEEPFPAGVWKLKVIGLDLNNLNLISLMHDQPCNLPNDGCLEIIPLDPGPCTRSPGYWKNHVDKWPHEALDENGQITIAGVTYTPSDFEHFDGIPDPLWDTIPGDKTYTMYSHLLAAVLSEAAGADSTCIRAPVDYISAAQDWLLAHPVGSGVTGSDLVWTEEGAAIANTLELFYMGELCAPHCDGDVSNETQ